MKPFSQGDLLLSDINTVFFFFFFPSWWAIALKEEKEKCNAKEIYSPASDKLLLFLTRRKKQYYVKVVICTSTTPPVHLPVLSFLSQFGEFCLHQLDFCRPVPLHEGARLSASPVIHKLDPKFKCEPHTSCHRSFLCGSSRCAEHAEQIRWSVNCLIGGKFCYFLIGFSCLLFLVIRHPNSFALWFWWWWIWCTSSDSGCESAC